jgi:hypothetical protein
VPYKTRWVKPEPFTVYKGVVVYHAYIGDDIDTLHFWFYTTQPLLTEEDEVYNRDARRIIDVRVLPNPDGLDISSLKAEVKENHKLLIRLAIDTFSSYGETNG